MPTSDVDQIQSPVDTRIVSRLRERVRLRLHRRALGATVALMIAAAAGFVGGPEVAASAAAGTRAQHAAVRTAHHVPARAGRFSRGAHLSRSALARPARRSAARRSVIVSAPQSAASTRGRLALSFALAQIGKPYVHGSSGPDSYDCSGLAQRSWRAAGIQIPRTTQQQARFGAPVTADQMEPGDLVIFFSDASHVGLYAGDGKVVVAPRQGTSVTVQPMRWMPVDTVRRPG